MKLFEELKWRGLIKDIAGDDLEHILNDKKLHLLGNRSNSRQLAFRTLLIITYCKRLSNYGHHPILLVGGATGLIGDPRPTAEREIMNKDVLKIT